MTKGRGSDANPIDGDRVTIELELRDGRVWLSGSLGIVVAAQRWVGGARSTRVFASGEQARAEGGETFAGCEIARAAALAVSQLVNGKSVDEAFALGVPQVLLAIGYVRPENERCVLTAIGALRSALIDAQVAALAEATVEAKKLSLK
jgi:hypothetical protein